MWYYWLSCKIQNSKILILLKPILPSYAQRHSSNKAAQLTHTAVKCRPHTAAEVHKHENHRCIQTQPSNREHQLSQAAKSLRGLGIGELANTPWLLLPHQSWAIWPGCILEQVFSPFITQLNSNNFF